MITRVWKVYGKEGHRQRESFNKSQNYKFVLDNHAVQIEVLNADKIGTNDYSMIGITSYHSSFCQRILDGQISDGIYENSVVGEIIEVFDSYHLFEKFNNEEEEMVLLELEALRSEYMFLSRLQQDCDYFLGNGNRCAKHLWAMNVKKHIQLMFDTYNKFSEENKPDWINENMIKEYERKMLQ